MLEQQQDEVLARIKNAFRLYCRAEVAEGRRLLEELWEELGPDKPYHRSVTAHYLADTQVELEDELMWDLRAMEAAQAVEDEPPGSSPYAAAVKAFLPSLHLNLADCYRRMGDFDKARHHAEEGAASAGVLGLDHYGQTVRGGLIRVQTQIDELDKGPSIIFDFD
jgi:tetratricopeptide (TPR) repeat protein